MSLLRCEGRRLQIRKTAWIQTSLFSNNRIFEKVDFNRQFGFQFKKGNEIHKDFASVNLAPKEEFESAQHDFRIRYNIKQDEDIATFLSTTTNKDSMPNDLFQILQQLKREHSKLDNSYFLHVSKASKNKKDGTKWDIKKVLDQYRGLTKAEKTKLLEQAREKYREDFKRAKENMEGWHVPEFLDPEVDPKSLSAKASRQLWDEMCSQRESVTAEDPMDKQRKNANKILKEEMSLLRADLGFHQHLVFYYTPYRLYIAQKKKEFPSESYASIREKYGKNWKENISETELANFKLQSQKLRDKYDAQNMLAANNAIAEEKWLALKILEIKSYGKFNKKRPAEVQKMLEKVQEARSSCIKKIMEELESGE